MGMTSDQVAQIIAGNSQWLSQQQDAVQRQNMLYGIQPGQDAGAAIGSAAGTAGSWAGQMPDAGLTAVGLAADFNYAPRIFSPFSATINAGMAGYAAGGLGAAIPMAAATYGVYAAAGSAANYLAIDPFKTGAQTRGMELSFLSQTLPGVSMQQLAPMATQMEGLNRQGFSTPELTGLMQQGIMGGQLNTNSISGFQQGFSKLVQETKEVAAVLHTSLNEAYQAIEQVKGLGVSSPLNTLGAMRGLGQAGGIDPSTMMQIAQGGSSLAKMAGINRDVGVHGAMNTAATFGLLGQTHALGNDFGINDAGTFQNAAYRFFGSQPGTTALAAMMDSSGHLDANIAARMANGGISREEMNRLAAGKRGTDMFQSHSQELVATYLSEYGPAAINNPLLEMTRGSYHQQSRRQGITGLNNEQLGQLATMSQSRNQIAAQVMDGSGSESFAPQLGIQDTLKLAIGKMTAPIRDHFSNMATGLVQSIAEMADDVTKDFVSRVPRKGDPAVYNKMMQAASMGQTGLVNGYKAYMDIGRSDDRLSYGRSDNDLSSFSRLLPMGLTHSGMDMSSLPGGGWLPQGGSGNHPGGAWSDYAGPSAMAAGLELGGAGVLTGMSAGRLAGRVVSWAGESIAPAAIPGHGFTGMRGMLEGLRGVGLARGTQAGLSGGLRLAGMGVGAASIAAGYVGAVYTGAQVGTWMGNEINEAAGFGNNADVDYGEVSQAKLSMHKLGILDLSEVNVSYRKRQEDSKYFNKMVDDTAFFNDEKFNNINTLLDDSTSFFGGKKIKRHMTGTEIEAAEEKDRAGANYIGGFHGHAFGSSVKGNIGSAGEWDTYSLLDDAKSQADFAKLASPSSRAKAAASVNYKTSRLTPKQQKRLREIGKKDSHTTEEKTELAAMGFTEPAEVLHVAETYGGIKAPGLNRDELVKARNDFLNENPLFKRNAGIIDDTVLEFVSTKGGVDGIKNNREDFISSLMARAGKDANHANATKIYEKLLEGEQQVGGTRPSGIQENWLGEYGELGLTALGTVIPWFAKRDLGWLGQKAEVERSGGVDMTPLAALTAIKAADGRDLATKRNADYHRRLSEAWGGGGGSSFAKHLATATGGTEDEFSQLDADLEKTDEVGSAKVYRDFATKYAGSHTAAQMDLFSKTASQSPFFADAAANVSSMAVWAGAEERYGLTGPKGKPRRGVAFLKDMLGVDLSGADFRDTRAKIADDKKGSWGYDADLAISQAIQARILASNGNQLTAEVRAQVQSLTGDAKKAVQGDKAANTRFMQGMGGAIPGSGRPGNSAGNDAMLLGEFKEGMAKLTTSMNNWATAMSNPQ